MSSTRGELQTAPNLKVVKADQHYTRKHETVTRPLRRKGWQIVMNQPEGETGEQERVRPITVGKHNTPLLIHCGTILPIWTPPHLLLPPNGLSGTALQQWYDDRKKYQWVVVHTYPDGRIKIICPQCKGNVRITAKTRNPNRPNRSKQASDLPATTVPDTKYCCDGMITLQVDQRVGAAVRRQESEHVSPRAGAASRRPTRGGGGGPPPSDDKKKGGLT